MVNITSYIAMGLSVVLLVFGIYHTSVVGGLEEDIKTIEAERNQISTLLGIEKANNSTLKTSINKQNSIIQSNKTEYEGLVKKLDEWKSNPPKIKYKTIYETIYKEASNECNSTKDILNGVRTLDFDSL